MIITLDEAIKHAEEVAYQKDLESGFETDNERYAMTDNERLECKECAKEQRQLAEWLKELKRLKEQEPCEDCISREDLREPRFIIAENDYQKGWNDALNSVYENAPSIQSKTGHWIQEEVRGSLQNRCSICDRSIDTIYFYNYCPNCGIKMIRP